MNICEIILGIKDELDMNFALKGLSNIHNNHSVLEDLLPVRYPLFSCFFYFDD